MTAEPTQAAPADVQQPRYPCHCVFPDEHGDDRCAYGNGATGKSHVCKDRHRDRHVVCWGCSCSCHRAAKGEAAS